MGFFMSFGDADHKFCRFPAYDGLIDESVEVAFAKLHKGGFDRHRSIVLRRYIL